MNTNNTNGNLIELCYVIIMLFSIINPRVVCIIIIVFRNFAADARSLEAKCRSNMAFIRAEVQTHATYDAITLKESPLNTTEEVTAEFAAILVLKL